MALNLVHLQTTGTFGHTSHAMVYGCTWVAVLDASEVI